MSTSTPVVAPRSTSQPLIPPEEKFWVRYSPHSEAPLSGVTSTVLHILAIGLLLLIMWINSILKVDEETRSLSVDPVKLDLSGGGGGSPGGNGGGPGGNGGKGSTDGDTETGGSEKQIGPTPPQVETISPAKQEGMRKEFADDETIAHYLAKEGGGTRAFNTFTDLADDVRNTLRKTINPGAGGKGRGGSGQDGGRDTGKDKGDGGGKGEGKDKLSPREIRILRWGMTFNTTDGRDYLAQLTGLGAMVAIPVQGASDRFLLIRDLRNPNAAKVEDVTKLDRIYWVDNTPASVSALLSVVPHQQATQPSFFVAFFPKKLEDRLLELELDHTARRYNGLRDEKRIHETKFDVFRSGTAHDVRVREVYLKNR